jgi:integrase
MLRTVKKEGNKKRRSRGTGSIGKVAGSPYFYIWYRHNGRTVRESTHSESKMVAESKLALRIGETAHGIRPAQETKKFRYEDARGLLLADYEAKGRKSLLKRANGKKTICGLVELDKYFAKRSLGNITADDVRDFISQRQAEGAGPSIINRSNAALRRMLVLARREGKLREVPYVPMLKEPEPRQGFLYPNQFAGLLAAMPENLRPILRYLYLTGCRTAAAKKVDWTQVVFDGKRVEIALRAEQVKNSRPLTLPLPEDLASVLRAQTLRSGPVFDATNLTKAFRKACVAVKLGKWRDPKNHDAGYDGLTLHDLRRSGVRNLRRAGVSEDVAMKISGHRTRAIFSRYNIVDSSDLHDAMKKASELIANSLQIASDVPVSD